MKNTPEQIAEIEFIMMVFGFVAATIMFGVGFWFVYDVPYDYKNNDTPKAQYVMKKATQKTLQFLLTMYAFLLPMIFSLIYLIKSAIVFHPCGVLLVGACIIIKNTKKDYIEDFKKEYEKLQLNNS